jgi:hypothetical protein
MTEPVLIEWGIKPIGARALVIHLTDSFPQTLSFLFLLFRQKKMLSQQHVDHALQVVGAWQALTALPELKGPGFHPDQ